VVTWRIVYTSQARKDAKKLGATGHLRDKAAKLLKALSVDPYQSPPPFERLRGDLEGVVSRRINIQHRLVYQVLTAEHTVKVLSMWTHYHQ
jgi:Txe/YoeB family toxin of toxin-antitoxin system